MGEITGRKVFIIVATAFGVVIAVNLTLAWQAIRTFPGLEVRNSYVASQNFDAERAAQLSLGWTVEADYDPALRELQVKVSDPEGKAADVASLSALVGWATSTHDDFTPEFEFRGGAFVAPADLETGNWNVRLQAVAPDGTRFHQRIPLHVKTGG